MLETFSGPGFRAAARTQAVELFLDHVDPDDPGRKERLLAPVFDAHLKTPQHAAVSALTNAINSYDGAPAAAACRA